MNDILGNWPYIMIIILLLISIIILITILITSKKIKKANDVLEEEIFRKEVNLINEKILELNEHYNFISEQLDAKQKELLFLYQMISLKEQELGFDVKKPAFEDKGFGFKAQASKPENRSFEESSEAKREDFDESLVEKKLSEFNQSVVSLYKQGYKVEEIAKKLGRGKGEVSLAIKIYC